MLAKSIRILFILIFFLSFLSLIPTKAFATNCRFTTNPTYLTPKDKEFSITITPSDEFISGEPYTLRVSDSTPGVNTYSFSGEGRNPIERSGIRTPGNSPDGVTTFEVRKEGGWFSPIDTVCGGRISIGVNPDCKIVPTIEENSVRIRVDGLPQDTTESRRGFVILTPGGITLANGCISESELSRGGSFLTNTLGVSEGVYRLYLKQGCTIFGSADGPTICKRADGKSYTEIGVTKDGLYAVGAACDPSKNYKEGEKAGKNDRCNVNSPAPYCLKNEIDENFIGPIDPRTAGYCSNVRGVVEKCTDGFCLTSLGKINTNPQGFVSFIFTLVLGLGGGILLLFLILNGYKLMTSQGDPEKLKETRESITSAVVGLLFIIFSIFILQLVTRNILQIPGF